jgi:Mg-chelatase subunit ChlD
VKEDLTQISIVLDRSGSMSDVRDATIAGFNEFVEGQKAVPGDANVTLIQFDTENPYEVVFNSKQVKDVPKLTTDMYVPRGGTPLHDALGRTIDSLGVQLSKLSDVDRPGKVVIVVMTDGLENSSKEYSAPRLADMIKHQREAYKWEFVFLGANQDAILTGERLNIPRASSVTYAAGSVAAMANVFRATTRNLSAFRRGASASMSYSRQDRKEALEEDDPLKKKEKKLVPSA